MGKLSNNEDSLFFARFNVARSGLGATTRTTCVWPSEDNYKWFVSDTGDKLVAAFSLSRCGSHKPPRSMSPQTKKPGNYYLTSHWNARVFFTLWMYGNLNEATQSQNSFRSIQVAWFFHPSAFPALVLFMIFNLPFMMVSYLCSKGIDHKSNS